MRVFDRKKTFIDKTVQGRLVTRVLTYWLLSMLGIFGVLAGTPIVMSWFVFSEGAPTMGQLALQAWRMFWPCFFASGLVLPVLLLDVVRVSHRIVGPVYRLRHSMREMADGKPVTPIQFREGDFWYEMAEEFNRIARQAGEQSLAAKAPAPAADESTSVAL